MRVSYFPAWTIQNRYVIKMETRHLCSRARETLAFIKKGGSWLFSLEQHRLILFRTSLLHWNPSPFPLRIRNYKISRITHERIDRFFGHLPRLEKVFRVYLDTGACGWMVHNETTWMGFTWSVDLSLRETDLLGRPRRFTYVGLPAGFDVGESAWYGFSAEVNPRYRGKGVFFCLIDHSYRHLRSLDPASVVYSSVLTGNMPSIKTKLRLGETVEGKYTTMDLRLAGRHFSNIYCSRLQRETGIMRKKPTHSTQWNYA